MKEQEFLNKNIADAIETLAKALQVSSTESKRSMIVEAGESLTDLGSASWKSQKEKSAGKFD